MREIVILSGKGGTGKTTVTASLAELLGPGCVLADCDVDASDLHLLIPPVETGSEAFISGSVARLDPARCEGCSACVGVCRFDALRLEDGVVRVDEINCEGCEYCARICPPEALTMVPQEVGKLHVSRLSSGGRMVHAWLAPGGENSGKLVAEVKRRARQIAEETATDVILVDGSPGIGCPVVSSLSGADFVLFVTEPTLSGAHDLARVGSLVKRFNIPGGVVVNKADLNPDVANQIERDATASGFEIISRLPYDQRVKEALHLARTPLAFAPETYEPLFKEILNRMIKENDNERENRSNRNG